MASKLEGKFLCQSGRGCRYDSFGGGAGGSRRLRHARRHPCTSPAHGQPARFFVYERSLPSSVSMARSPKAVAADSPAKGQVQAKTGTLTWDNLLFDRPLCTSKALAGYLTTAKGKRLRFAASSMRPLKDGIDAAHLIAI